MQPAKQTRLSRNRRRCSRVSMRPRSCTLSIHLKQNSALRRIDGMISVAANRSEEHTSELQSLKSNSYAVFCLKKKKKQIKRKIGRDRLINKICLRNGRE